ncbi:MAG: PilZ domain-containing protein [bacterium]|nr:PilZ domain-containing protein [bacterium]
MEYESFALIYDSDAGELGQVALTLMQAGIDVLYAADPDEAMLLASQESDRLGALLTPSSLDTSTFDGLIERVCPHLAGGIESLLPIGLEPSNEVSSHLRKHGVRWCLWEPFEARELRFATAAALMAGDPGERRKTLRAPAHLFAGMLQGSERRSAVVCDLSSGGAYLGIEASPEAPCFETGSEVDLELPLQPASIFLRARVAHTHDASSPPRADLPGGMGVEFLELGSADLTALSHLLDDLTRRFRL